MKTLLCALGAHPLEECPQWIPIELISTNSLKHDQFATVLAVPLDKAEQRRAIRCLLSGRPVPLGRKEHIQRFLEYEMISLNFAPEVIDSFASWAKERTGSCPLSADTMHTLRESGTHSGVKNYSVSSEAHLSLVLRTLDNDRATIWSKVEVHYRRPAGAPVIRIASRAELGSPGGPAAFVQQSRAWERTRFAIAKYEDGEAFVDIPSCLLKSNAHLTHIDTVLFWISSSTAPEGGEGREIVYRLNSSKMSVVYKPFRNGNDEDVRKVAEFLLGSWSESAKPDDGKSSRGTAAAVTISSEKDVDELAVSVLGRHVVVGGDASLQGNPKLRAALEAGVRQGRIGRIDFQTAGYLCTTLRNSFPDVAISEQQVGDSLVGITTDDLVVQTNAAEGKGFYGVVQLVQVWLGPNAVQLAAKKTRSEHYCALCDEYSRHCAAWQCCPDYVVRPRALVPCGGAAWAILMDFCPNGTLEAASDPAVRKRAVLDLARCLQQLSAAGITHGDVAARNVLIDAHGGARLCDFGLAAVPSMGTAAGPRPAQLQPPPGTKDTNAYQFKILLAQLGLASDRIVEILCSVASGEPPLSWVDIISELER